MKQKTRRKLKSSSLLPLFRGPSFPVTATDVGCFLAYICSTTVLNLPVVLIPVAAAESTNEVASFVASIASVAVFGSALGKLLNGFVCEAFGNQRSSFWYLIGLSLCTKWFASGQLTYAYAGMEFFGSIQWTALSVLMMKRYANDPAGYTKGMAAMSLASTGGNFMTKTVAIVLLQYFHWRTIANMASYLALIGALIVLFMLPEIPPSLKDFRLKKMIGDTSEIMSNRLFWVVGVAHSASMLGRGSDRIMGAFFHAATHFSPRLSGGLTISSTFGLFHSLRSGRSFCQMDGKEKLLFMKRRYIGATVSALSLAVCAYFSSSIPPNVTATWIAISAFGLTSCTGFLFFTIPNTVANTFASPAVCLSTIDAVGFGVAATMWKAFGVLASNYNFTTSWMLVASIFVAGGAVMIPSMQPLLQREQRQQ